MFYFSFPLALRRMSRYYALIVLVSIILHQFLRLLLSKWDISGWRKCLRSYNTWLYYLSIFIVDSCRLWSKIISIFPHPVFLINRNLYLPFWFWKESAVDELFHKWFWSLYTILLISGINNVFLRFDKAFLFPFTHTPTS